MKGLKQCIAVGICLGISVSALAKIMPWNAELPGSLSAYQGNAQQLAELTGERILIYAHPATKTQLPTLNGNTASKAQYYSAAVVLPVAEAQVKKLLQHYPSYVGLFPTLKSAKLLEQQGPIQQVKYQVHIPTPIPVLNFKESVVMQHHLGDNSISTLIIDAPIPYGAGKLEWFALDAHRTLVTITQWGDLNQPKGFLFSKILNALPEAKFGIPASTNAFLLEALQQRFKSSHASPLTTAIPQLKFNAQQLQKIAQLSQKSGQPVSFILPNYQVKDGKSSENLRFSSTYQYFPHSLAQLQPWISAEASQQLFPHQIRKVELSPVTPQSVDANYKVSVGLGVIQIPFNFKMRFYQPDALQNQFNANGGDLKFVKGGMKLLPQSQGNLLQITSSMKIHDQAPFLLKAMRSLPYHDVLPAIGGNTVYALKVQQKLR
ncbi:MAG: SRPBCC family protein [Acinetobacter sp.]